MERSVREWARLLVAAIAVAGCSRATPQTVSGDFVPATTTPGAPKPAAEGKADSGRPGHAEADVRFMQAMIAHHAQALVMARWARTRGARGDVKALAERIDVGQRDEIAFMQRWLRERGETVPDIQHAMAGHHTPASADLMPGMLSEAQMSQLADARGAEFDRLLLTSMIQHHEGALTMVQRLFSSQGAAQDVYVFRFASDVQADQTAEIARMRAMLPPSVRRDKP